MHTETFAAKNRKNGLARLLTFYKKRKAGKGHKEFDFGVVNEGEGGGGGCGTRGCLMGELPIIFPEHFAYSSVCGDVLPIGMNLRIYDENLNIYEMVSEFFGLQENEVLALFEPNVVGRGNSDPNVLGLVPKRLPASCTLGQALNNVKGFLKNNGIKI